MRFPVMHEVHLLRENMGSCTVLERGKFCDACPGRARSRWEDTGLNQ